MSKILSAPEGYPEIKSKIKTDDEGAILVFMLHMSDDIGFVRNVAMSDHKRRLDVLKKIGFTFKEVK